MFEKTVDNYHMCIDDIKRNTQTCLQVDEKLKQ